MTLTIGPQSSQARMIKEASVGHSDAPAPWRSVGAYSELAAIIDADGYTVTICRVEIAERIVRAVNQVELGRKALALRGGNHG